ncbi:hypothetical protein SODALDRAFT_377667 [Sodiomyces alkalinus F11]|uniref:Uncharacterized protein n=1 Tax=Sodiomyces alkalinus (strain CBS 110278 / VKM F-3762 / F11) TaxID=1314773 RepID=A0A3N2PYY9_SODAK|nr:hypothetical protein SODALDRAFT_377667 [Sodiomyces alkalinus F11]ROT39741.1 hypothetical protein SODALDRAFT_377667 [Sodiomyces alkalinus F11]
MATYSVMSVSQLYRVVHDRLGAGRREKAGKGAGVGYLGETYDRFPPFSPRAWNVCLGVASERSRDPDDRGHNNDRYGPNQSESIISAIHWGNLRCMHGYGVCKISFTAQLNDSNLDANEHHQQVFLNGSSRTTHAEYTPFQEGMNRGREWKKEQGQIISGVHRWKTNDEQKVLSCISHPASITGQQIATGLFSTSSAAVGPLPGRRLACRALANAELAASSAWDWGRFENGQAKGQQLLLLLPIPSACFPVPAQSTSLSSPEPRLPQAKGAT